MIQSELEDIVSSVLSRSDAGGTQNVIKIIFKNDKNAGTSLGSLTSTVNEAGGITSTATSSLGTLSGNKVISGWVSKEFQLDTTVSSNPINNLGILKAAGSFINQADVAKDVAQRYGKGNNFGGDLIASAINALDLPPAGTQFGGSKFSREIWENTSKPAFSVDLIMINTSPSDNITADYAYLSTICYPSSAHASTKVFGKDSAMTPPSFLTSGSIDVRIGDWFYATNLIITGVRLSISKQTISDGSPLFATANIGFKSFRMLSAGEYSEWFTKAGSNIGMKSLTVLKKQVKE